MQIYRLFGIMYHLLNKNNVTANELAERFGVSKRTIYRDLDILSASGIPLYTVSGKGGGIRLMDNFILNKQILSENEQKEILSALHGLLTVKTDETGKTLSKLETFFNRSAPDWFEVDFSGWGTPGGEWFPLIKTAIFESRILEFDYYSSYGEKTTRRVEPHKLWFKSYAWYFRGFCLMKNSVRHFKLSRIKNLTVTDETFRERQASEIQEEPDGIPKYASKERVEKLLTFKLRLAPEMAYRVYDSFDPSQYQICNDGSFIVTQTEIEDEWIYGYILSYGHMAEVLEPERLREAVKGRAQAISNIYS